MKLTDQSLWHVMRRAKEELNNGASVVSKTWQGVDISNKPEMVSYEVLNFNFVVALGRTDLVHYQRQIQPNLPWADDHFAERVCGYPLNPGKQWENWPWAQSADKFRANQQFNHTYMERLWPRFAGYRETTTVEEWSTDELTQIMDDFGPNEGIRNEYGDLNDLVELLSNDPMTRQAYIPLFFPEDTGIADGGRKPCILGYQIIMRNNEAHIYYPIRSCDFVRHFRDDVYLAVRFLLWVIEQCAKLNPVWSKVVPGTLSMHCTSLHIFKNDWPLK